MVALGLAGLTAGCDDCGGRGAGADGLPEPGAGGSASATPSGERSSLVLPTASTPEPQVQPEPRCPPDMVRVARRYCVDRFEAILVDSRSGERLSPYYSPSRKTATYVAKLWQQKRLTVGDAKARAMPLPELPLWQRERDPEPKAVARKGMTPNGHVNGEQARAACRAAGKRQCTIDEWQTACRGEGETKFPYGDEYQQGVCNVFREAHPAMELHDNPSKGHSDPRLNLVKVKGRPLLRKTGGSRKCRSEWDGDAIRDMVGNLDEWVDNPEGQFAGGFYARSTRDGCDWTSTAHPMVYADYSTGVRCCADLPTAPPHSSSPAVADPAR